MKNTPTDSTNLLAPINSFTDYPELVEVIERCRETASTRILRLPLARAKMGQAASTFWAAVKRQELPPPINISIRSVGWLESELDAVISARIFATRTGRPIDIVQFIKALTVPQVRNRDALATKK